MSTYPTYQAAKIANPESEIVTTAPNWNADKKLAGTFERLEKSIHWINEYNGWIICHPADYCMTANQFLGSGHKFIEGDIYLNLNGKSISEVTNPSVDNKPDAGIDHKLFILKAKALEETKTYRYEKVTDSIFELKEEFERGCLYAESDKGNYLKVETDALLASAYLHDKLYRRIEVTERELFIEEAMRFNYWDAQQLLGQMYDSGKFKLVNGKG